MPSPPTAPAPELETLLAAVRGGDVAAREKLYELLYADLRRLARAQLYRAGRSTGQIETTTLVHELYLRLAPGGLKSENRASFLNLAARVMRQVIIDLARRRRARKRGEALRVAWPDWYEPAEQSALDQIDLLALEAALGALERESPRLSELVDLRFFGGLTFTEIAALNGLSERTLKRDWRRARAFLEAELGPGGEPAASPPDDDE